MTNSNQAALAYDLVKNKANSNSFLQGVSGVAGFPFTLLADAGSIPLIYVSLWNDIRRLYGHDEMSTDALIAFVKPMLPEVLLDIALDKFLGNVPVIGIYFNAICAKTLTWRFGTLFAFLSSRGADIPNESLKTALALVREVFPQREMFTFTTPERAKFIDLVVSIEGASQYDFGKKVDRALSALRES